MASKPLNAFYTFRIGAQKSNESADYRMRRSIAFVYDPAGQSPGFGVPRDVQGTPDTPFRTLDLHPTGVTPNASLKRNDPGLRAASLIGDQSTQTRGARANHLYSRLHVDDPCPCLQSMDYDRRCSSRGRRSYWPYIKIIYDSRHFYAAG